MGGFLKFVASVVRLWCVSSVPFHGAFAGGTGRGPWILRGWQNAVLVHFIRLLLE